MHLCISSRISRKLYAASELRRREGGGGAKAAGKRLAENFMRPPGGVTSKQSIKIVVNKSETIARRRTEGDEWRETLCASNSNQLRLSPRRPNKRALSRCRLLKRRFSVRRDNEPHARRLRSPQVTSVMNETANSSQSRARGRSKPLRTIIGPSTRPMLRSSCEAQRRAAPRRSTFVTLFRPRLRAA